MNEELVLHILNTACYGLNLHLSLVPQAPYLYVFFDRSPDAALNYPVLTETIRLAAASAGLPPEYEYLALYSRVLGEEHPDWETAIYLYESSIPPEANPQAETADSEPYVTSEFSQTPDNDPSEHSVAEIAETPSDFVESAPLDSTSEPEADFEALFGGADAAETFSSDQALPQTDLSDELYRDPTIVFEAELPQETPSSSVAAEFVEDFSEPEIDPLAVAQSGDEPLHELDEAIDGMDVGDVSADTGVDLDIDLDFTGGLPLPPPPPPPRHLQAPPDPAQVAAAKMGKTAKPEDDMSQYYFRAKAKPKIATIESNPTESSTPPQAEIPSSVTSDPSPSLASTPTEASTPKVDPPTTPPPDLANPQAADLSSYCFIRNKLMLSSTIKPPSPEVIALIAKLHPLTATEKVSIASLLDKLYRQPEKSSNEEGAGEALMYQPPDINLEGQAQPVQALIQEVLALEPESFRKSAIWFSRYCYNPQKTIGELGINN